MANRKRPPQEVEDRHRVVLTDAATKLSAKRLEAWTAELFLRRAVRSAFQDGLTVGPIKETTGLSTPRLYQIKHEVLEDA